MRMIKLTGGDHVSSKVDGNWDLRDEQSRISRRQTSEGINHGEVSKCLLTALVVDLECSWVEFLEARITEMEGVYKVDGSWRRELKTPALQLKLWGEDQQRQ